MFRLLGGKRALGGNQGGHAGRPQHPLSRALPVLQVQDESGRGTPAGFMICSSDTVEVVEMFLRVLLRGVRDSVVC